MVPHGVLPLEITGFIALDGLVRVLFENRNSGQYIERSGLHLRACIKAFPVPLERAPGKLLCPGNSLVQKHLSGKRFRRD